MVIYRARESSFSLVSKHFLTVRRLGDLERASETATVTLAIDRSSVDDDDSAVRRGQTVLKTRLFN